ncbi:hypothetical protein KFL_000160100 [Klebsormidium nitens]|uniref:Ubiquitin-like protease family profile domain-containing protein n=1 Tax=Klebsormidium nitens TaxID=105231 RepID=A0A1Y1HPV9_KLENI|nr:hypothetical protein KFL_000160100 [Klebsormidium nitens]|eukprot:GAQ78607.1 hypothetical protein KFL_000160100 [Klebsormidium nitens]
MPKRLKLAPTFDTAQLPAPRIEAGVQTDHVFFYKAANSDGPVRTLTALQSEDGSLHSSAAQIGTARLLPFQCYKPFPQQTADASSLRVTPPLEDGSIPTPHPGELVIRRQRRSPRKRKRRHTLGSCIDLTESDDEEGRTAEGGALQAGRPLEEVTELREGLRATPARAEAKRWSRLEGRVCNFPDDDGESIAIHGEEVRCLAPGAFLNDTIIEFYMRWLQINWPRSDLPLDSCLFLNSFFYKKLKQLTTAQRLRRHPDGPDFHRLRRWTKGIDLLAKQYIFVPIHDLDHWTLAVICFPEERMLALPGAKAGPASIPTPAILHLDSLGTKHGGHATSSVTRQLKSYLAWEVLQQLAPRTEPAPSFSPGAQAGTRSHKPLANARPAFNADKILVKRVPVPLQQNDFDCGLFLLHSLETFVTTAPAMFRLADLTSTLQLGRTWYPSESASLRRLDLLRMLERLFGLEELPDEADDAGTSEVEFMGSGAAGQAAAQKQLTSQIVGPPQETPQTPKPPVGCLALSSPCSRTPPLGDVTATKEGAFPAASPSLPTPLPIQSSDPAGVINPSAPTGCLPAGGAVPSAQTSQSAQSPPELNNEPAAVRVEAGLEQAPDKCESRTGTGALRDGADVIVLERGTGVEDRVSAAVCLPSEPVEPVSSVQGSGSLESTPGEAHQSLSVGLVVESGLADLTPDTATGRLDTSSPWPVHHSAVAEAVYGCTEERKRAEGLVETAVDEGGGQEAAGTGERAPHEQAPAVDEKDAMEVDVGADVDFRGVGPSEKAEERDGGLANGTNGGAELPPDTTADGSAISLQPSEWEQLEEGRNGGGYQSENGAVLTVEQPFLPSDTGVGIPVTSEAVAGPQSLDALCQQYIADLIASTLRQEVRKRCVELAGADELFLSGAVQRGPGAQGSISREALAGVTKPSLLPFLESEPLLPGSSVATAYADGSSLLPVKHEDAAEIGALEVAVEIERGQRQVGEQNQRAQVGVPAGPVESATEGGTDSPSKEGTLNDMETEEGRGLEGIASRGTPRSANEHGPAASHPQETGDAGYLPGCGKISADLVDPAQQAEVGQLGVGDVTWLGAERKGCSQQLADWAPESGRGLETGSLAGKSEAGAQCQAMELEREETVVEGGAKMTESTIAEAEQQSELFLDAMETFGVASVGEEGELEQVQTAEEMATLSSTSPEERGFPSGNDFLQGIGAVSSGTHPKEEAWHMKDTEPGSVRDGGGGVVDRLPNGETERNEPPNGVEEDESRKGRDPDSTEDDPTVELMVGGQDWIDWVLSRPEEAFN